ncbi:hypothetical protein PVK06_030944 [Gossypium arboreum]|uniref:Uncharacterized protein n=1 Tax=Gossypium arboreum TaxID=29729 RepID=A0ABR0NQ93_GOSAR|nr:hypothetical protein PVK06_030944 [Gossypium arboreum]
MRKIKVKNKHPNIPWNKVDKYITPLSMGSQKQNKISMDVATDHSNSSSLDYSLSFTSLVCIDPPNHQSNKDQSPHDSNKSSRPDSGGGHLLPLEFLLKSRPPSLGGDGKRKWNGEVRNQGKIYGVHPMGEDPVLVKWLCPDLSALFEACLAASHGFAL